jgi:hypothetical protein
MWLSASPSSSAPSAANGITLRDNGQVGIGVYFPAGKLHVAGGNPTYVNIDAATSFASGVALSENGTVRWRMLYHPGDAALQLFKEYDGTKVEVQDDGDVLIGVTTSTSSDRLEVDYPSASLGQAAIAGYSYFVTSPSLSGGIGVAGVHFDDGVGGVGVYGEATSGSAIFGSQVGVYGYTNDGYGVISDGNLGATGMTTSIVKTKDGGWRHVYAMQSSGNYFEDFGQAALVSGEAIVNIDPVFAQTVSLSSTYHVFLTPLGDCGLYVAEKNTTSFTVRAVGGKQADLSFDYRIVAKRSGYESYRLETAMDPDQLRKSKGVGSYKPKKF